MKKYDRGWASLETGAALLIVMLLIAWGAGIWQDYIQTKGWQTEARLVSNWTSAARSYIGKNYTTLQGSSTNSCRYHDNHAEKYRLFVQRVY